MSAYDQAIELINHMMLVEKARLLEHLSAELKHDIEIEAYKYMPWDQFIDLTYGSLADDPIERNQPSAPDVRDEIE